MFASSAGWVLITLVEVDTEKDEKKKPAGNAEHEMKGKEDVSPRERFWLNRLVWSCWNQYQLLCGDWSG